MVAPDAGTPVLGPLAHVGLVRIRGREGGEVARCLTTVDGVSLHAKNATIVRLNLRNLFVEVV